MRLFASLDAWHAREPGLVLDGLPSRHRALRAAAYALGGIIPAPPGGWALALVEDGAGGEVVTLGRAGRPNVTHAENAPT